MASEGTDLDTDTASSRSVSFGPLPFTSSAWCGFGPGPVPGHLRTVRKGAAGECSDAVIPVAVVDREIEASCGATPEVVEARDGTLRVISGFRRVVFQQAVHQLDNRLAERRILASVVDAHVQLQ